MAKNGSIKVKVDIPEELQALAKFGRLLMSQLGAQEPPKDDDQTTKLRDSCLRAEQQAERALKNLNDQRQELQTCRSERDHLRQQVESLHMRFEGGTNWQTERQSLRVQVADMQAQQQADVNTIRNYSEELETAQEEIRILSAELSDLRDESINPAVQRLKEQRAGLMNIIEGLLPAAEAHLTRLGQTRRDSLSGIIQSAHRVLR